MQQLFTYWRVYSIFRRITVIFVTTVLLLFLTIFLLLRIPAIQNWVAEKTTSWLSEKLDTEVSVKEVSIDLLDHLILEGLYIEDKQDDTLLYAGKLEVNIGTINPLVPYVKIKSIGLYDTRVYLDRTLPDSIYNFDFISEAFSSSDVKDTSSSSSGGGRSVQLKLNRLDLNNVHFVLHDEVAASDMQMHVGDLELLINTLDLEDHIIALEKLQIDDTRFALTGLTDTIPSNTPESWDTVHIAMGDWVMEASQLKLHNCAFAFLDVNDTTPNRGINFSDMDITGIDLEMTDIIYHGDTIMNRIDHLALTEKSGFRVDTLHANVLFSPYEISLTDLLIKTPNSKIQKSFAMTFTTLNDFDRFESDVRMDGNFDKTIVGNKDLAYFAPVLDKYDAHLLLSGHIYGALDNLKGRDFDAMLNESAGLRGTLNVKGLPNIDETFIDMELEPLYVNTYRLENIIGAGAIPDNLLALGTINYTGRVTGFAYDLVTLGNLTSDQGNMYTDVHFQYDPDLGKSSFRGDLNTSAFNVGIIAGEPDLLGRISMHATIDGSIARDNEMEMDMQSEISMMEFNDYTYSNMVVDGNLENDYFSGNFTIDDPNVKLTFNGIINMQDSIPLYDFKANIARANLKQLNFYPEPIVFSATASADAGGTSLDNIEGNLHFGDLLLIRDKYIYRLDTLNFTAAQIGDKKSIKANSTLIDLQLEGNFLPSKLDESIKSLVDYYTNGRIDSTLEVQKANYTVSIKNADRLMAIFYPDIQEVRNLTLSGDFNTATRSFNNRLRIDQFNYQNITLDTLLFEARTANDALEYFTRINATHIGSAVVLPVLRSEGNFAQNTLNYNFKAGKDTDSNRVNLNGAVAFIDSSIMFNILPSEIFFEAEKWDILPNNSLKYDNKNLYAQNFTLNSGNKVISLSSSADATYGTVLKLGIRNIPIGELAERFVLPGEDISGTLDATYTIGNALKDPSFLGGAEIKDLTLNHVLLGNLKVNTSLIQPNNVLKFNSTLSGENGFVTDGYYIMGRGEDEDSLQLKADFRHTKLFIVEPFLRGILSDMSGDIYGTINIDGPVSTPQMQGSLQVKNGGMTVDYMGTHYAFNQIDINVEKNKITIPETTITDKLNNTASLKGEVTYSHFDNWNFKELHVISDNLVLMETNAKQNPDFYGYAIGEVDCNITGKLDALLITVDATPHSGTVVNLPTYGSGNVKKHDFIRFVNKQIINTIETADELNLAIVDVALKLNATPDAQIKLLINSEGTEFLSGRGFGALTINANSLGKVDMVGTYRITEGLYDFSFQGFVPRPFTVIPGSTIEFSGSPYKAQLDLTAEYTAENVSINTLTGTDTKETANVNVLINIDGVLESPEISFDLEVADGNAKNNADFERRINEIKSDKNELNKQVFGLLIMEGFLPQDLTAFNAVGTTASSTMNDFFSSQLTTYFQNVLDDFIKDTEIDFGIDNIQSGNYNVTTDLGNKLQLDIKREVTDNLIVKVGTTYYDFTGNSSGNANNLAGDFEVEYIISPDGRVRVKAFRISEYDAIVAKNDVKTGVGIYYSKDFNKLKELFKKQ